MKFLRILLLPLLSVLLVTENQALGKFYNSYLGISNIEECSKKIDARVRYLTKQGGGVSIGNSKVKVKLTSDAIVTRRMAASKCINTQLKNVPETVQQNIHKFFKKIPENSIDKVKITIQKDGTYLLKTTLPGKVPGSMDYLISLRL